MKKLLLFILLIVIGYCAKAQSITINNTTGCDLEYVIHAGNPGMCSLLYLSGPGWLPLNAGNSITYYDSTMAWNPLAQPTPPWSVINWLIVDIHDLCSPVGSANVGNPTPPCSGSLPPSTNSFYSSCCHRTITLTWTIVGGNSIITIS